MWGATLSATSRLHDREVSVGLISIQAAVRFSPRIKLRMISSGRFVEMIASTHTPLDNLIDVSRESGFKPASKGLEGR